MTPLATNAKNEDLFFFFVKRGFFSKLSVCVSSVGRTSVFAKSKGTGPPADLGVPSADLEPESFSPFTPPLHLPFRLIWGGGAQVA